ncbi:alanine dehydrogenase [Crocinitomicaceae bacterium]|nr:alanine dehydrogenase [Crocinitomicaceae bacterium]
MKTDPEILKHLLSKGSLLPQEEMLEIAPKKGQLFIGIPKETFFQERRVALVPEAVSILVLHGHRVKIESKSGEMANFSDRDYSEAGAEICYDPKEVFECDMIFKVGPPSEEEIDMMKGNQTLVSALQITISAKAILQKLMQKKITAIAWDYIRDDKGVFPIVRAMSEIAGTTSILIAGELLSCYSRGKGIMLGGITGFRPAEVVVIGAGTVGEFAIKGALGLGASVKVFDSSMSRLRRVQDNSSTRLFTYVIQPKNLAKAIANADVVIGALRAPLGRTPCVVTEEMVESMSPGSVLIDVSIDQGGCFETSRVTNHKTPTFVKHGVIHYCVPNIASRVSRTASSILSNIFAPILLEMGGRGGCSELIKKDTGFRSGVYIYKGVLTSEVLGKVFDLKYKNIELLMI